ncbi:hypothetical protein HW115_04950 [Verrucomicrobiaceae bacterium N1E253]|uniref:Uncharacterized protein n=1 Tax=Oceaniferula marina TaxID=2748318 RepID=A0A851GIA8_9BACT|nr:hypothetical protein [Oceaniferula marina]NWK54945.1 hypothetical protein [Oceaniferula marina]
MILPRMLLACVLFGLSANFSLAGFKVPSSVFTTEQLEEAKSKAEKDDKALAFVYTDSGST